MGKVSEIMLLKQPKQSALAVEVHTDMNGMSEAIGKNFVKIDSLFKAQGEITTDIPYVEYPDFESLTEHNIKMIIGLKSSRELQGEGDIRSITIPERKIVSLSLPEVQRRLRVSAMYSMRCFLILQTMQFAIQNRMVMCGSW